MANWRFYLLGGVLLLAGLLLLGRLAQLQLLPEGVAPLQDAGDARSVRTIGTVSHRGMITDRNGEPLAISTPVKTFTVNPGKFKGRGHDLLPVAKLLGLNGEKLLRRLQANAGREFMYIKRHVNPEEAAAVIALGVKGLEHRTEYKRYYPAGEVAAHVVGFTDIDGRCVEGMEMTYNKWLTGKHGKMQVLKDRKGQVIKHLEEFESVQHGKNLPLSIDLRLQYHAYKELKAAMKRFKASSGSVVVLDIESNEVLAMVNQPSYNPNQRNRYKPSQMRNRAVTDLVEPGSTVKPLTMVAALESGKYSPRSTIDTSPGYLVVEGKTVTDHSNYRVLDLAHIIQKSSQVGTSKIALSLKDGAVREVLERVGFGEDPMTGFPGESAGTLPDYTRWHPHHTMTMAYGYGLSATPLQIASVYSVLANQGVRKHVSLIKRAEHESGRRVIDESIARKVNRMMLSVTEEGGTGTKARIPNYIVSGKTGTAHRVGSQGYDENAYVSAFAGFVPAENPRLVAVVIIDDPKGEEYYGGAVAAPVFANVMRESLRLMNVAPDDPQQLAVLQ
jgi:cell division protein FtsI (penicillin-binding protein 3)